MVDMGDCVERTASWADIQDTTCSSKNSSSYTYHTIMAWVDTCAVAAHVTKMLAQAHPQFYHCAFLIIVTFIGIHAFVVSFCAEDQFLRVHKAE